MDSQTTLVDADFLLDLQSQSTSSTSADSAPDVVLFFTRDDMKNTRICSVDRQVLYTVATDVLSDSRTVIYRGDSVAGTSEGHVATVNKRTLFADTIAFGTEPPMKLSNWLHGADGKWSDLYVQISFHNHCF